MTPTEELAIASVMLCAAARNYAELGDVDEQNADLLEARERLHTAAMAYAFARRKHRQQGGRPWPP